MKIRKTLALLCPRAARKATPTVRLLDVQIDQCSYSVDACCVAGSMAALGICMLLLGLVVGVVALLLWQRRRNRQFNYRRDLDYSNM